MSSTFQTIRWLPMEESIDPKSSHQAAPSSPKRASGSSLTFALPETKILPTVEYARKQSVVYARQASIAFARRISGAFALFMVYWQGHKVDDNEALLLKDTIRGVIKEHNTLNQNTTLTKRRGTYGQVGMPHEGAIGVYVPPYDKVLLEKIAHLPDVAYVERPLPFHLPSDFSDN